MAGNVADDQDRAAAKMWLGEMVSAEKRLDRWHEQADKIVKRYRDERRDAEKMRGRPKKRLNLLWSNVQTMLPSLYAKRPEPICERRFLDRDPVGRVAATIWERVLRYEIEDNGYDDTMERAVLDYLLAGRGHAWVRYAPKFRESISPDPESQGDNPYDRESEAARDGVRSGIAPGDPGGNPGTGGGGGYASGMGDGDDGDEIEYERTGVDYVHYRDFLFSDAPVWEQLTWVARRIYMGRDKGIERFGDQFKQIPLRQVRLRNNQTSAEGQKATKATLYEIWCIETRKVHFVAEGHPTQLEEVDDPLHLDGFWPCPKPLSATMTNDTLIPVPDFAEYQDQADEIDSLTSRISLLTSALRVVGAYDGSAKGLARLLDESMENKLVPVDNWAMFAEKGGMDGAVSWLPVKDVAGVLVALMDALERQKQALYEVTGISDIIRGQSDPRETLGAQELKGGFATQRLQKRQKDVAKFARDVVAICGEIVAEHFSPRTMIQVSGVMQDEGVIPPQAGIGHNGGPPMDEPMQDPNQGMMMIMQALALLRDEKLRGFRIDLETDSTIALDAQTEKKSRAEFVTAMGAFLEKAIMGAQAFPPLIPLLGQMMKFAIRGFRVGRDLEAAFDEFEDETKRVLAAAQQAGPPPDPKVEAERAKAEADMAAKQADVQANQAKQQAEMQREDMRFQHEMQLANLQAELEVLKARIELQKMQREEEAANAEHRRTMEAASMGMIADKAASDAKVAAAKQRPNGGTT